ncbi:MAG: imidazole glycerol phosphate synthase subunit HisH, partial [Steroidobacteraceae bacterium]|nr:imidazole glycerol phosphate synthase subunit HisH [Steroidobacteraceae bacterium]
MNAATVIVDSGGANLASLQHALARLHASSVVSSDPRTIAAARRVLLPGVGSAGAAMQRLRAHGLAELLPTLRQPLLGICLGMQLLFEFSEEGSTPCLGLIRGEVRRLRPAAGLTVPHMGWNALRILRPDPLLDGVRGDDYVYFVHSF